jgi:hypothetical protein
VSLFELFTILMESLVHRLLPASVPLVPLRLSGAG